MMWWHVSQIATCACLLMLGSALHHDAFAASTAPGMTRPATAGGATPDVKNGNANGAINPDTGRIDTEPLTGLIINRTITVLGWDFYQSFAEIWRALYPDSTYTLTIVERPTAKFGSEIWITYSDRQVFHRFIPPARSHIRDESKQAVAITHENINRINVERLLFKDDDLGDEEL